MMLEQKRLFVRNLPAGITEDDLKVEFNNYGSVSNVEIKQKENFVDPENPNVFAFINVDIDPRSLKKCIDDFNREECFGRYLTVTEAKESFLDRLKREREENNSDKTVNITPKPFPIKHLSEIKREGPQPKKIKFANNEEEEVELSKVVQGNEHRGTDNGYNEELITRKGTLDEDDDFTFVAKKKASSSFLNGKIRIQSGQNEPLHVINLKSNADKILNEKGMKSEEKRKKSLVKMKDQYTKQKLAIQNSLASMDTNKTKRITFDDDLDDDKNRRETSEVKKVTLFNEDDDEENEENSKITFGENRFEGKKGERLMKLQSKFQLDPRFKMDSKFIDDDENENDEDDAAPNILEMEDGNSEERLWQLNIIEQVIGKKLDTLPAQSKVKLRKTMLRFDPSKEEHKKFLKNVKRVARNIEMDPKDEKNDKDEGLADTVNDKSEVSKEQFFTVTENLSESLKRRGDGFSLLSMFGKAETEDNEKTEERLDTGKSLSSFSAKNLPNPFSFDSSDSENEDGTELKNQISSIKSETKKSGGKQTKSGVWNESFFFISKDQRLQEGAEFFRPINKNEEGAGNYDAIKDNLRKMIHRKITKSKKNKLKRK